MKLRVTLTKTQECFSVASLIVDVPDDLQGKPKEIKEWLDDNAENLTYDIHPSVWKHRHSEETIAIHEWKEA